MLHVSGQVQVPGDLEISAAELTSTVVMSVFQVTGSLALVSCTLRDFVSTAVLVGGQVLVRDSAVRGSLEEVFAVLSFGVELKVVNTQFLNNAAISGAVFFVSPAGGSGNTTVSVDHCEFAGNSATSGGSVLYAHDLDSTVSAGTHSISFSECQFSGHPTATFQLMISQFLFVLDSSQFDRDTQVAVGTLVETSVSISRVSVTNCAGPPLSFQMSGVLHVAASNFTSVAVGPLLVVQGVSVASSLVRVEQVRVLEVLNMGTQVYGVLVNAMSVTLWMEDVELRNFTVIAYGVHYLVGVALFSNGLAAYNGNAVQNIIGVMLASSFMMNSTYFENVNSEGTMWMISSCTGSLNGIVFHEIMGVYYPMFDMYNINLFMATGTVMTVDDLQTNLVHAGIALLYNFYSVLTLTNSVFTGKLGLTLMTIHSGVSVIRNTVISLTGGQSLMVLLLGSTLDFDRLALQDVSLQNAFMMSSGSSVTLTELFLSNVSCTSMFKGKQFRLLVHKADISKCAMSYLVDFSIGISVNINALAMRDSVGSLLSVFNSNITITNGELSNLKPVGMLMYLSSSFVELVATTITQLMLQDAGSLATLLDSSVLRFTNTALSNISSSEHGVMTIKHSSFGATQSLFRSFNMSLITAQYSSISIVNSQVLDMRITFEGKSLSMLPSGGLIRCTDCSVIVIMDSQLSNIAANQGAVIYAALSDEQVLGKVELIRSHFDHCTAKTSGGVISTNNYNVDVRNCSFAHNSAETAGVAEFIATSKTLKVLDSSFVNNSAAIEGSCIYWEGAQPVLKDNVFSQNRAAYGDPLGSTPHHYQLLDLETLTPAQLPAQGVTGQQMSESLVIGVFDILGDLIVTDNSTVVTLQVPSDLAASGSLEVLSQQGLAFFNLLFTPFSIATVNLVFYSQKTSSIANITIPYRFRDCKAGEIRTAEGCFPCSKNSYSFDPTDSECLLCPSHAVCNGETEMYVDQNYWRSGNLTDVIYPCFTSEACLGGLNQACSAGYYGTLCGACQDNYYPFGFWACRDCEGEIGPESRGFIIATLLVVVVTVPPAVFLLEEGPLYRLAVVFRVFGNYAHTVMFAVLLHTRWPFAALVHHEILRTLGTLGAVLLYPGCQYQDLGINYFYFQVIAVAFFPLAIGVVAATIWLVAEAKLRLPWQKLLEVIASTSLLGAYTFLPTLALMTFSMFQCQQVESRTWLVADMSQVCWTGDHELYIKSVAVPLLIFVILAHLSVCLLLWRNPNYAILRNVHKYLESGFELRYQKWELQVLLRKFVLACLSLTYTKLDRYSQIVLFSCVIGISFYQDSKRLPYASRWLNVMNLLSHVAVFATVFIADSGTTSQVLGISCAGTFLVISSGAVALKQKMRIASSKYELARVNPDSAVSSPNKHYSTIGQSKDSLIIAVPPGTPQDAAVNSEDIRLEN